MKNWTKNFIQMPEAKKEEGSALVIALLILMLLMAFASLAISRTTTEIQITSNDVSEGRTYAASEASLENMTRDFVDLFEQKLVPNTADINTIKTNAVPDFDKFSFDTEIVKTDASAPTILTGGSYSGLYSLRDAWEVSSYATDITTDVKVQLRRRFYSDRIPIFQFGMFYEDDLELFPGPIFSFGGRVHTNGNLFVSANKTGGVFFNSRVSVANEIVNDTSKSGPFLAGISDQSNVFVSDASGIPQELITGEASVKCVSPTGTNVFASNPNLPYCVENPDWATQKAKFQGNLENKVQKLNMPLSKIDTDMVELVKRGKNVGDLANSAGVVSAVTAATTDSSIVSKERFSNKSGIRISLSDSQNKLPGCATAIVGDICGIRLDGPLGTSSIGYQPLAMTDGYRGTPLNATRMAITGREVWIKVELTSYDISADLPVTVDVTEDILSLGVTEAAPLGPDLQINGYNSTTDTRSVIKLQRFSVPGPSIPNPVGTSFTSHFTINGNPENLVVRYTNVTANPSTGCSGCTAQDSFSFPNPDSSATSGFAQEDAAHLKWANITGLGTTFAIVPFPIQMFDTREGLPNDSMADADANFGVANVPAAGVMSMVDIDVANLRRFFQGEFDTLFPATTAFAVSKGRAFKSTDVPNSNGWVLFVSDRRGDFDFDGEYDMEDVFPDSSLQFNEDINLDSLLNMDLGREAVSYTTAVSRGQAATADHLYYRRGVRLINGSVLPGTYDSVDPGNTRGFSVASENGIYVKGNYNATGATVSSTTAVTPPENFFPQNSATHIPASIVADAVTVLSNNWTDANSFANPFRLSARPASDTIIRFAMLSGDAVTGNKTNTYVPSGDGQRNGGVHNYKRFLENWSGRRLNYAGSLINLFNSRNNNGFYKCCTTVYSPPIRDWTFDTTFLNPYRLPPGTPNIFSITFTGFERVND